MGCVSSRTLRGASTTHKVLTPNVVPSITPASGSVERTPSLSGCDSLSDAGQSAISMTSATTRRSASQRPWGGPGFSDVTSDVATIAETVADMRDLADLAGSGSRGPKTEDHCYIHEDDSLRWSTRRCPRPLSEGDNEDAGSTTEGCRSEAGSSLNGSVGLGSAWTRYSSRPSPLPGFKASPFSIDSRPHPLGVIHPNQFSRSGTPSSFVASDIGELGSPSEHEGMSPNRSRSDRYDPDDHAAIKVPSIRVCFENQAQAPEADQVQSIGTTSSSFRSNSSYSSRLGTRCHSSPGIR